jgi:hypothetical protein
MQPMPLKKVCGTVPRSGSTSFSHRCDKHENLCGLRTCIIDMNSQIFLIAFPRKEMIA